jgi:hypothetical protein
MEERKDEPPKEEQDWSERAPSFRYRDPID